PARPMAVAAFDTRIKGPTIVTGSAAKAIAKALDGRGLRPSLGTASFVLDGVTGGPYDRIPASEVDRAPPWARELAEAMPAIASARWRRPVAGARAGPVTVGGMTSRPNLPLGMIRRTAAGSGWSQREERGARGRFARLPGAVRQPPADPAPAG